MREQEAEFRAQRDRERAKLAEREAAAKALAAKAKTAQARLPALTLRHVSPLADGRPPTAVRERSAAIAVAISPLMLFLQGGNT